MVTRSNKKKSSVVSVDFTDVESGGGGGLKIPEGSYQMEVAEVSQETSSNDNEMFKWVFKGTEGKAKGKTFWFYTPLNDESLWKLRGLLEAMDVEVPDGPMDIDLEEMVGLGVIGIVTDETYQGKISSKMTDFERAEGEDAPEPETKKRGAKAGGKKASTRKGKGKEKEIVKVSADEVKAMDEEELAALIEEHELEVDLEEYKTARRKTSAVIAALEEKDLIEEE